MQDMRLYLSENSTLDEPKSPIWELKNITFGDWNMEYQLDYQVPLSEVFHILNAVMYAALSGV